MFALRPEISPRSRHLVCLDLVRSATRSDGVDHPGLERRIAVCRRLLIHARCRGWDITHVHPRSASRASRPVEGLEPHPNERLIYRTGVSAFSNRSFCQAVKASAEADMILIGFSLSSACLATALTAHDWGLPVVLAADAVLGGGGGVSPLAESERHLRDVVAPFVRIAAADELIDPRRNLRLVSAA